MKSRILKSFVLTLIISFFTFNTCAFAEQIGVVDLGKILENYTKSVNARQDLSTQKANLQKFVENARKTVQAAKTQPEKKKLEDKYNAELKQKIATINQQQTQKGQEIQTNIFNTIKTIAEKRQIPNIFTKESLIIGGTDITDEVITTLNASAGTTAK